MNISRKCSTNKHIFSVVSSNNSRNISTAVGKASPAKEIATPAAVHSALVVLTVPSVQEQVYWQQGTVPPSCENSFNSCGVEMQLLLQEEC
jgi:hypothetical protein